MDALFDRCAGIDVHRDTFVVSVRERTPVGRELVETRTFETYQDAIADLIDWLDARDVTLVGLESTGVYWQPLVRAMQARRPRATIWLINPAECKRVPGRKTDVTDSQWLSKIVMYGLVSPSMLAPNELVELRVLTRHRRHLVSDVTALKNRIVRQIESAGIKLSSVCSDVFGKSGRAMLDAYLAGGMTAQEMAELARGTLRGKKDLLVRALQGDVSTANRIVLVQLLKRYDLARADVADIDKQIAERLEKYRDDVDRLKSVPGIDDVAAGAIIAEMGTDTSIFENSKRLTAWAGLAPGSYESGGKSKGGSARAGDKYLRTSMVQAAWAAVRTKACHWRHTFGRIVTRLGPKKAIVAIARRMLAAVFHILREGSSYRPALPLPPDQRAIDRALRRAKAQIESLGFIVTITPNPAGATAT